LQYKERKTGRRRTCRLSGEEFMRRFLQHVLPRGSHKVRYYGLWHPAQRHNAARVRQMLQLQAPPEPGPPPQLVLPSAEPCGAEPMPPVEPRICPHCHYGRLIFIRTLPRDTPRQAMAP
jgi:Putative transposase